MANQELKNRRESDIEIMEIIRKVRMFKTLDITEVLLEIAALIIAFIIPIRFFHDDTSNLLVSLIIYSIGAGIIFYIIKKLSGYDKSDYDIIRMNCGENFPVEDDDDSTAATPNISAPAAKKPAAPMPVTPEPVPAPESVVISCEKCGQQMLIPANSGTVKITCPKCGNSFIHTN